MRCTRRGRNGAIAPCVVHPQPLAALTHSTSRSSSRTHSLTDSSIHPCVSQGAHHRRRHRGSAGLLWLRHGDGRQRVCQGGGWEAIHGTGEDGRSSVTQQMSKGYVACLPNPPTAFIDSVQLHRDPPPPSQPTPRSGPAPPIFRTFSTPSPASGGLTSWWRCASSCRLTGSGQT
jgi:hypothetical protein